MNISLRTFAIVALIACTGLGGCHDNSQGMAHTTDQGFLVPGLMARPAGLGDEEFAKVSRRYTALKQKIESDRNNPEPYVELAQLFLQEARITGRHHEYVPQAQATLDEALRVAPGNFDATITKASMMMTLHQFAEAKKLATDAIAGNPYSAFAYGVLCDAHLELGEYDEAVKASDAMLGIRPDLRSYARASYLREIHGDRDGAIQAMTMAADAGAPGMEDRSWALYNLAGLFMNQGKLDTAAFIYNGILQERPNYPYALSGLAAVKTARGEYPEAIEMLVKATQLSPEHLFVEQLSDVYLAMGARDEARTMEKKAIDAYIQHEKGGWNIDREYAAYCAGHDINLSEALARAKKDYDRRPANIDALDTYAWLLYKNGNAAEAAPLAEQALRLNTPHPALYYHAGLINYAAGNNATAAGYLRRALRENAIVNAALADTATGALAAMAKVARR